MNRVARSVLAAIALAVLTVGVPLLLVRFGSWPLHQVPTANDLRTAPGQVLTDSAVFSILTVAAWLAWAAFTVSVVLELIAALRGTSRPHLPFISPLQNGARQLVASLMMTATLTGPLSTQRVMAAPTLPSLSTPVHQVIEEPPPQPTTVPAPIAEAPGDVDVATLPTVQVTRGDSPWSLAEDHLGDGLRWREIWDLNRGVTQPDGRSWVVEDQIDPGWMLHLPADATGLPSPTTAPPATPPSDHGPVATEAEAEMPVHVVEPGDTLSDIAHEHLGDADRYREIYEANTATEQPNGARLTDPDLIQPGWTLHLPSVESGVEEPSPAHADAGTADVDAPSTTTPPPVTTEPPQTSTSSSTSTSPSTTAPESTTTEADTATDIGANSDTVLEDGNRESGADAETSGDETEDGSVLPALGTTLAGITGATVLATGLAALIRKRRKHHTHQALRRTPYPSDAELAVIRASDVPLVRWAGQALGAMARQLDRRALNGVPVAVEISEPTGIEVLWDRPQPQAPEDWEVADGGWAWRHAYDPDAPLAPDEIPSPLPSLVTVGHRQGRQLLVNLEALGTLAITGDPVATENLARSIALELATSEDLADTYLTICGSIDPVLDPDGTDRVGQATVSDALRTLRTAEESVAGMLDDEAPTAFAVRAGTKGVHVEATVVMVDIGTTETTDFADDDLPAANQSAALLVLGDLPDAPCHLMVDVDGSARLDPLGIEFDVAGVPVSTAESIDEHLVLLALSAGDEDDESDLTEAPPATMNATSNGAPASAIPTEHLNSSLDDFAQRDQTTTEAPAVIDLRNLVELDHTSPSHHVTNGNGNGNGHHAPDEPEEGAVVMPRLLVKVLGRPHVPDRPGLARREVVLTAYLACHRGPATTSGIQDAIWNGRAVESKTLWNLVARTRRALGSFDDGTPVMPQADRTKHTIALDPQVATDLAFLRTSYELAVESSSAEAIPLLRDALNLVEGPPFDAVGYDWAHHIHQHVAEASALIEQAAELLARLAHADGDTDLARHALVQGLRALPGNEVLYRHRMQLEYEAGNTPGVQSAFDGLVAYLSELDCDPSDITRAHFDRLTGTVVS